MAFLVVSEMTRWIEISHWGNVVVEEAYLIVHEEAQLNGSFSSYNYQGTPTYVAVNFLKGPSIKYARKIFRKTNISNPLIRTRTRTYQGVRNVSFSENFASILNG